MNLSINVKTINTLWIARQLESLPRLDLFWRASAPLALTPGPFLLDIPSDSERLPPDFSTKPRGGTVRRPNGAEE